MKRHANLAFFVPHLGCPHACVFCDQKSISGEQQPPTPAEVTALCDEMLPQAGQGQNTEIAFFGGSFTAIPRETMLPLLEAAYPFVESGRAGGIRISTRPDAIDDEVLAILRRYGVRSIELGAQSMSDEVLKKNGRGHTVEDVENASRLIKKWGFSLGLQMMVGMYGEQNAAECAYSTMQQFIELHPDTVRIYPTLVVENTPLALLYKSGRYTPLSVEDAADICAKLISRFRAEGINVIRVGLHSEMSLQQSVVAGPFHPAFGELCEGRIMRQKLISLVGDKKQARVLCPPRVLSQVKGHKNENILYFKNNGIELTVTPCEEVSELTLCK